MEGFHMKRSILFILCIFSLGLHLQAQVFKKSPQKPAQTVPVDAARLEKHASELMANYVTPTKVTGELAIPKIDEFHEQLSRESLMFPADELYHSNWDTVNVDPFRSSSITFPDTYTIDCSTFTMPINNEIKITSKYGPRRRKMHQGTDLKVIVGDTIRVAFDGRVRIKSYERRGFGYYLVIRHPNGLETVYGHLSKFLVNENQIVRAGEVIGLGGNTGRSTGSHLHFETRFLGKSINPEELIDFENGVPHKDEYVFRNVKVNGKNTNTYITSDKALAIHRVKKGETLSRIAVIYGTTVDELCTLNGLTKTSTLAIGQAIRFRSKPVTVEASSSAIQQTSQDAKQNQQTIASTNRVTTTTSQTDNNASIKQAESSGEPVYHRIEAGDTLYSLSKKYNTTIEKICELNNIQHNIILRIGQKLRCS